MFILYPFYITRFKVKRMDCSVIAGWLATDGILVLYVNDAIVRSSL